MVATLIHQLTKNATTGEIENSPMAAYYIDHAKSIYPAAASGNPWKAEYIGVKGDPIADLVEDLAAEQKARATYDNILRMCDDKDVERVIRYLREREVVHFQRFGDPIHTNLRRFSPYEKLLGQCKSKQLFYFYYTIAIYLCTLPEPSPPASFSTSATLTLL